MGETLRDPRKTTSKALKASPGTDLAVRSPTLPAIPGPDVAELLDGDAEYLIEAYNDLTAWLNKTANIDAWRKEDFARDGEWAISMAECALEPNDEHPEIDRIERGHKATWDDISAETLLLIGAFAPGNKELAPYADQLAHRIAAQEPTRLGISWACRHLVETWEPNFGRSVPSIKHLLDALKVADLRNSRAISARRDLPRSIAVAKQWLIEGPKRWAEKCLREKAESEARNKKYEKDRAKRQHNEWLRKYREDRNLRLNSASVERLNRIENIRIDYMQVRNRIWKTNMADADKRQALRDLDRERESKKREVAVWYQQQFHPAFSQEWDLIRAFGHCSQDERDALFDELLETAKPGRIPASFLHGADGGSHG